MVSTHKILLLIFFLFCSSILSFAEEKVYTNEDLKPGPSLDRDSRIDPATGKKIEGAKDESRKQARPEGIVMQTKNRAALVIHEMKTNKMIIAALFGIMFLIWIACLLDIRRFEFSGNNKLIWIIVVTFIPMAGCILYFFIGKRQKKNKIIRDN